MAIFCGLGIIALGAAALYWAAANGYLTRPVTSWLTRQLGRSLETDGGLRIEFGRVTRLSASGVRLANVAWGTRRDMLLARSVVIDLDTRSVFRDTLIVRHLAVEGLDLQLERNAAAENNWTFEFPRHKPSTVLPVIVEAAALPGSKIRFTGPPLQRALDAELGTVEERVRPDGMLALTVRGLANATPLELQMSAGPLAKLIATKDFGVQAQGQLGEISLTITARVDSWEAPADTEAALSLQAPNAEYFVTHLGLQSVNSGPVALEIKLAPARGGSGVQGYVSGQIGEFAISAHGSLSKVDNSRSFAVQGQVAGPDLSRLGGITGVKGLPAEAFQLQLDVQHSGDVTRLQKVDLELADGRVTATGTLGPGSKLPGSELAFSATTPDVARIERRLDIDPVLSGGFEAVGSLHQSNDGETTLDLKGTTTVGTFTVKGPIGRSPNLYGTRLVVSASGTDFARLGKALQLPIPPVGAYKGSGNVEWNRGGFVLRAATLSAADETVKIDGSLGRPLLAPGADLRLELTGANAARLGQRFGVTGFPASPYKVSGRLQRQKGRTVLSGVKASVASAALELDGTLGDRPNLLATNLTFIVAGPAVEDFHGLSPGSTWPRGKFRAAGELAVAEGKLHLSNVQATLADAQGTGSAEFALPLDTEAMWFNVDATVPNLAKLLPRITGAVMAGQNLRVITTGSRLKDRWTLNHLRLENGSDLLDTQGEFDISPRAGAKDLRLEVRLANLRKLGLPSGHLWPDQPLVLHARFSGTGTDLTLREMTGRVGSSDFAGTIAAQGLGHKPDFDVRLTFGQLDLNPYFEKGKEPQVAAPTHTNNMQTDNHLVIPADDLPVRNFNQYTGKLTLNAQLIRLHDQDFQDLNVQATLGGGRLRVDPLTITVGGTQVDMRLDLMARDRGMTAHLSGSAKNLRLYPLLNGVGGANASVYSAQVDLEGSGGNLRELAGTLNGRIRLIGNGGRVTNSGLMAGSNGFLKQLLTSLNPVITRQPMTEVVCVAYLLRAKDGVLATDPALVMRTAEVDILSNGTVDLSTERIDFSFKTAARRGLGLGVRQLINPYIKVTGTLGKPGVALDPTGALVNGGAAFATAGLSVVATTLWDRVVHEKNPCAAAVADSDLRAHE